MKKERQTMWTPKRIKELRKLRGETQEEFAKHFRMTLNAVRIWEQNQGKPSGPVCVILDLLHRSVDGIELSDVEEILGTSKALQSV